MEQSTRKPRRTLTILVLVTVFLTILLLGLGNIVTRTNSGLGCSDHWPTCNGKWIPDFTNKHVVIEFGHRMLAGIVGFLTLFLTVASWRVENDRFRTSLRLTSMITFFVLVAQVILGGITVKMELPPAVVIMHNGFSIAFFSFLVFLTTRVFQMNSGFSSGPDKSSGKQALTDAPSLFPVVLVGVLLVYAQILLGAYVRHSGSLRGCPDLPLCQGQFFPPLEKTAIIHYSHRLLGIISGFYIFYMTHKFWKYSLSIGARFLAIGSSFLVILQIVLGGMTVISNRLVLWSTLHLMNASFIIGILVILLGMTKPLELPEELEKKEAPAT